MNKMLLLGKSQKRMGTKWKLTSSTAEISLAFLPQARHVGERSYTNKVVSKISQV